MVALPFGMLIRCDFLLDDNPVVLFGLGMFDVDDIILNTVGCFAGYLIYWLASKIFSAPGQEKHSPNPASDKIPG